LEYNLIEILVPFLIATTITFEVLLVFGVFLVDLKMRVVVRELTKVSNILQAQAKHDGLEVDQKTNNI
jgi:hypothetical protein